MEWGRGTIIILILLRNGPVCFLSQAGGGGLEKGSLFIWGKHLWFRGIRQKSRWGPQADVSGGNFSHRWLIGMLSMEVSDEFGTEDMVSWNSGPFFRTISLPINQILRSPAPAMRANQAFDWIGRTPVDESWRRWWRCCRDQGTAMDRFHLRDVSCSSVQPFINWVNRDQVCLVGQLSVFWFSQSSEKPWLPQTNHKSFYLFPTISWAVHLHILNLMKKNIIKSLQAV